MRALVIFLKVCAPVFLLVAALHLSLGLGAEVLLGASLPPQTLTDPVLNSQNRFFGVAFSLYGVLFYVCASDLKKYQVILRAVLWAFLAAGIARLVSIATHGLPTFFVLALLASELLLPPLLLMWLRSVLASESAH